VKLKLHLIINTILVCWALLIPLTLGQTLPSSGKQAAQPSQRTPLFKITTASLFTHLLLTARKPGGIAVASACTEPALQTLYSEDAPLNEALEEIVTVDPQYRLENQAGVINLMPRRAIPAFLELKIAKFEVKQAGSVNEALDKLLSVPEVKKQEPSFGPRMLRGRIGFASTAKPFDVKCNSCSIRQALNAIARAQGQAVWVYQQNQCDQTHRSYELYIWTP
jgi:hypothetical protein